MAFGAWVSESVQSVHCVYISSLSRELSTPRHGEARWDEMLSLRARNPSPTSSKALEHTISPATRLLMVFTKSYATTRRQAHSRLSRCCLARNALGSHHGQCPTCVSLSQDNNQNPSSLLGQGRVYIISCAGTQRFSKTVKRDTNRYVHG